MPALAAFLRFAFAAAAITGCQLTPGSGQPTTLAVDAERVPASAALVSHAFGRADIQAVLVTSAAYEVAILGLGFEQGRYSVAGRGSDAFPFTVIVTLKGRPSRVYRASGGSLTLRGGRNGLLQGEFDLQTVPAASGCGGCDAIGPRVSGTFQATPGAAPPPSAASAGLQT